MSRVVPLQELDSREGADIILTWQTSADQSGRLAWEKDWIEVQDNGTTVHRTKVSFVTLDNSRHLSTAQQRAAVLHEIGHALGIQGHSSRSEDVMCGTITLDVVRETRMVPGITSNHSLANIPPRSYVPAPPKDLTKRDVNTLIRLYNCPGYLTRLE